jgi:hypothetical protein
LGAPWNPPLPRCPNHTKSGPRQREATGDEEGSTDYHAGNLPGTSRSPSAVIRRRASAVMPHVNQVRRRELERAAEALVRWSLTV